MSEAPQTKKAAPEDRSGIPVRAFLVWGAVIAVVLLLAYLGARLYAEVRETRRIIPGISYEQEVLAKLGGPERVARRLGFYLRVPGERPDLRYAAVAKLGCCGRYGVPALVRALQEKDKVVRITAAGVLYLGGAEVPELAVPALAKALADPEPRVRGNAAHGLHSLAQQDQARPFVARVAPALVKALGDKSDAYPDPRGEAGHALIALRKDAAPALRAGLGDPDRSVRIACAYLLMIVDPAAVETVPAFIEGLADESAETRNTSAGYLGQLGPKAKEAVPALLSALDDPESDVRDSATWALAAIAPNSRQFIATLLDRFANGNGLGEAGSKALERIGPEAVEAVPLLMELLKHPKPWVRREAAHILVRMGQRPKETVPVLLELIKEFNEGESKEDLTRRSSAPELADLIKIGRPAIPALLELVNSQSLNLRWNGIHGLGGLGPEAGETVPVLVKLLDGDEEPGQMAAAEALARIGPAAMPALVEAVASPRAAVRKLAIHAFCEMKPAPKEALPTLLTAALHPDRDTRNGARWALAKVAPGDERVTALLIKALEDPDRNFRWQSAYILGGPEFKAPAIPAALKGVLADPDAGVRQAAAVSFWKHTGNQKETVPVLIADLASPDRGTRWHAAEALGQVGKGSPAAIGALLRYVKEEPARDERGRKEPHMDNSLIGIHALGQADQGSPEVLDLLRSLIEKDKGYHARSEAMYALGNIGPPAAAALEALKKIAQEDDDQQLRQRASEAVGKIQAPARKADGKQ